MTDTSKQELIEEAAKAMYFEDCGFAALDDDAEPFRDMARVAFALFEQAHTPTGDERETLAKVDAELGEWLRGERSWCDQHHGKPDEIELTARADEATIRLLITKRDALRRTAVQEPSGEPTDDYEAGYAEGFHAGLSSPRGSAEDDRPQVQPSDAAVNAATEALAGAWNPEDPRTAMRAALRAAYEEGKKR